MYLDHSNGAPELSTFTLDNMPYNNLGSIFRDTENNYTDFNLHFFNGTNTITTGSTIDVDSTSFSESFNDYTLIRFNGKFVSGGYSATYNGTSISPFSDWSSDYAVNGPNYSSYSNTGVGGYKWIAIDVTSKKNGNRIELSNFKINGSDPVLSTFNNSTTGYRAYISHDNKFGSLERVSNSGETSWFNNVSNTTITEADSINGALQTNLTNSSLYDAFIDSTTSSKIYLIVGLPQSQNTYFTFPSIN